MSLEREQTEWFMSLMEHWGEEKGKAFFQKLGDQKPTIRSGHTQMAQLIIAGEDPMSPNAYSHHFPRAQKKGAPADWVNLEPVVGKGIVSALAKNAPHPHSARLWQDFSLTTEAQTIYSKYGYNTSNPDTPAFHKRPKLTELKLFPVDAEHLRKTSKGMLERFEQIMKKARD